MKIYLAADHAGYDLKEKVKVFLQGQEYDVEDCGAFNFDKNDDYPDFINFAAEKVSKNQGSLGIVFGKSGAGEAIVANKSRGIRAMVGFNAESVKLAKEHNNANVLSLGAAFTKEKEADELALLFINTPFSGEERHVRRIEKIREIENNF